jgi:hypothetical protein
MRLVLLTLALAACEKKTSAPPVDSALPPAAVTGTPPTQTSIGSATMEKDGTLVLRLRADGPGGMHGDGLFRYPPGHKDYDMVRKHVGGLEPGESKQVPPWPEDAGR